MPKIAQPRRMSTASMRSPKDAGAIAWAESGTLTASCSLTPGTELRVHRGTALTPLMSHLPRRVAAPPRAGWNILSFHEEGVRKKHRAVTHRHVVVDEGANTDRAVRADRGWTGLESAVLLRLALDDTLGIENRVVPDGGQGRLGDVDAVVEDAPADPNTYQPPEHVLEWRAVEDVEEVDRMQLPDALDPPERAVVDGADGRRRRPERFEATLHQCIVDRGRDGAEREEQSHDRVREHVLEEFEGDQVDKHDQKDPQPTCEQEDADRPEVEPVLGGEATGERLPLPEMVVAAVAFDGARD